MTESYSEEVELVHKLKSGDYSTLGELFALHRDRLVTMVHFRLDRRLASRVDADVGPIENAPSSQDDLDARQTARPESSSHLTSIYGRARLLL
ncbi:MAG: hypothetical protein AAGG44_15810, partial [Planctomycetota bacterium]